MKVKKSQIAMLAAAVLGVVAILMMLLNGLSISGGGETRALEESCFAFAFGSVELHDFNFMMFLPFLLVIVGIVGVALSLVMKGKLGKFIAMAAFAVAGILFFCYGAFYSMSGDAAKAIVDGLKLVDGSIVPGVGAIMAGIFSLVAAVASALATFLLKD